MNPKEFSWTEDQQVTVTNPTSAPFTWQVHGKSYRLEAGKTAKMPGFIAWIYVYNQALAAAQADSEFSQWNDEGFRQKYFDRFVAGVDDLVQIVEEEAAPEVTVFAGSDVTPAPGSGVNYEPEAPKRGRTTAAK